MTLAHHPNDMGNCPEAREIPLTPPNEVRYSICTLVTRLEEYREMAESFVNAGFGETDCEFLIIDNSAGNKADAFTAYNRFLQAARGKYIVLCHQDILLSYDRRDVLERRIAELDALAPDWALLGNAGGVAPGVIAYRLTDPSGEYNSKLFPTKVESLDENFIVAKREANLSLSHDLKGFHFYGADLCLISNILGWSAWVVDFNLYHKSRGSFTESFYEMSRVFAAKYQRALRKREIQTTCARICLNGPLLQRWLATTEQRGLFQQLHDLQKNARKNPALSNPAEEAALKHKLGPIWYLFLWITRRLERPAQNLRRFFAIRQWRQTHKEMMDRGMPKDSSKSGGTSAARPN